MPSFVKCISDVSYQLCKTNVQPFSQVGYPSIPPGFVSWPSSYSQSLFPSLGVSIQDFPAFCPPRRMKPSIRPQGSFSLNGQEWRRTPRCKPYFSPVYPSYFYIAASRIFLDWPVYFFTFIEPLPLSSYLAFRMCQKYLSFPLWHIVPRGKQIFSVSKWAYFSLLERGIFLGGSNYAKWIVMLSSGGTLTSWNVLNASHLSLTPLPFLLISHLKNTCGLHQGGRGDNDYDQEDKFCNLLIEQFFWRAKTASLSHTLWSADHDAKGLRVWDINNPPEFINPVTTLMWVMHFTEGPVVCIAEQRTWVKSIYDKGEGGVNVFLLHKDILPFLIITTWRRNNYFTTWTD